MSRNQEFYKTREEIENWLNKYNIKNYTLIPNNKYGFVVDVGGDVDLDGLNLDFIPVKFNKVNGVFNCSDNELIGLEFCPSSVADGFYCSDNELISLKFCPSNVGGSFYCSDNELISLKFCPSNVSGSFDCSENNLTSLEFCPSNVGGSFYCRSNKLTNLEFCSSNIGGYFDCSDNKLTNLEFCPDKVGSGFYCNNNVDLKQIQKTTNFKTVYEYHIKIKKELENKQLNIVLDNYIKNENNKTNEIKRKKI